MYKKFFTVFLVVITTIFLVLIVCEAQNVETYTLKLAHHLSETHPIGEGAILFKDIVEEKSSGKIKVNVFPAGQVGTIGDNEISLRLGTIDLCASSIALLSNIYKPISIFTLPYSFRDYSHVYRVIESELWKEILGDLNASQSIRVVSTFVQPARNVTSNRPIESVEDLKGLKIRTPPIPAWVAFWDKLGASPTPIAWTEVYTSLQLGVVDAEENPFVTILSANLQEVQKYLIITQHVLDVDFLIMNNDSFEKMSEELQAIVIEAGNEVTKYVNDAFLGQSDSALQKLTEAGMIVIEPDVQSFIDASKGFPEEFLDPELLDLFYQIQDI